MEQVKESAAWVAARSTHVTVDSSALEKLVDKLEGSLPQVNWDFEGIHYFDNGPLTVQYLLVLDALNFCFWPEIDGELGLSSSLADLGLRNEHTMPWLVAPSCYDILVHDLLNTNITLTSVDKSWAVERTDNGITDHQLYIEDEELDYSLLASGLKSTLENDKSAFDADRLQTYTGQELRAMLKWPRPLPLEDERIRLLHEVGLELERSFGGKAINLVERSGKSAVTLVNLITRHFPGFRDHSVYKGHQVFLYKRAQIFVADLWGAFKGEGYGAFDDIGSLTMFADYIVPAILRQYGVLNYEPSLSKAIDSDYEISPGSEPEVEIRACTIYAVEKMKDLIKAKLGQQVLSIELDLWLWALGLQRQSLQHHRTLSIYY